MRQFFHLRVIESHRMVELAGNIQQKVVQSPKLRVAREITLDEIEADEPQRELSVRHTLVIGQSAAEGVLKRLRGNQSLQKVAGPTLAHAVTNLLSGERCATGIDPLEDVELN